MRIFITGISGLLGLNIAHHLLALNANHESNDRFSVSGCYLNHPVRIAGVQASTMDLANRSALQETLLHIEPDVVVHTAALTDVDRCETGPDVAHQLNVVAARNVAAVAANLGTRLVHISTDQLFNGTQEWTGEDDQPTPINVYGETKWLAEQAVAEECPEALIIRTNFFAWGTPVRTSFSDWILRGLKQQEKLTMFTDVFFTPLLANQLADLVLQLLSKRATGVFHVAGRDRLSKYDFALRLAEAFGYSKERILPITVQDFPFKARRPSEMALKTQRAEQELGISMPSVGQGLQRLLELKKQGWPALLREAIASPIGEN